MVLAHNARVTYVIDQLRLRVERDAPQKFRYAIAEICFRVLEAQA